MKILFSKITLFFLFICFCQNISSQKQMEKLGRGIVALNAGYNCIYVGWRLLGNDPANLAFNLYKSEGSGSFTKVNSKPMYIKTDTLLNACNLTVMNRFYVKPVINGAEQTASATFTLPANTPKRQYVASIPMQEHSEAGISTSNAMPGDLDGDGEMELVVMRNGAGGDTARMMLETYKLDGTYLWRFEFGKNINQAGEHNAQAYYVVYDFDGDGKSEVCVRGSELSIFQAGSINERKVGDVLIKDGITLYPLTASLQRPSAPEYLFMLNGLTGQAMDSIKYEPAMGPASTFNTTWGGNERPYYQWMSVAYLDGKYPSIVTQRGIGEGYWFKVYGFDYRGGKFTMRKDSLVTNEPIAFGGHSIRIKDIDNDGKDEVLFTGAAVDHDMKLIYNQEHKGIGHGDGFQILDIDPDRPGLEWFTVQQNTGNFIGAYCWDAATGEVLNKFYMNTPSDPSRADAAPICPNIRGAQMYGGTQGVMDAKGQYVNKQSFIPCGTVYWDADLAKELIENANSYRTLTLKKYDPATGNANIIFNLDADGAGNATMSGATYFGDLLGDWREEVVAEATENGNLVLRIYTTTTPSNKRYYTLLHNPAYRTQLTCLGRIGGFYPDFYFGPGMTEMAPSPYSDEDVSWSGEQTIWDNGVTKSWVNNTGNQPFITGNKVLFDDYGANGVIINKNINIKENISPSVLTVSSTNDYNFEGTGSITGDASLTKNGKGTLSIQNNNTFTGNTTVWDGALMVNGSYNSTIEVHGGTYGGVQSNGLTGGRLSGTGTFLKSITLFEKGGLLPGNSVLKTDTFRIKGDLTLQKSAYISIDLGATPESKQDIIQVGGNFDIKDSVFFLINKTKKPIPGTYTLIKFGGQFSGSLNKIGIIGLDDYHYSLVLNGKDINLILLPMRSASKIVWAGLTDKWEKTTDKNWFNNSVLDSYALNDSVVLNDQGAAKPSILLSGNLAVNDVTVSGKTNYTLSGKGFLCGTSGLTKQGSGTLTFLANNTFTGKIKLESGAIEVKSNVSANEASPLGSASELPANFLMSNSQLRFSAPIAMGMERGITITGLDTIYALNTVAFSGQITGSGKIIKTGAGKVNFSNLNTYTGGTTIKEGTVTFSDNNNPIGTGLIKFEGGRMTFADNSGNTETFSTPIEIPSGVTAAIDLDSRMIFSSNLTGAGTLNLWTPYVRADLKGNWSAFSGTINVTTDADGGDFRITNSNGFGNAHVTLGTKVSAYPNGTYTITYGALSSTAIDANVTTPFTVGSKNLNTSFAGIIKGAGALTKTGTGIWTINNANTYTGATSIDGGSLIIENTTGSATGTGNVTVKANALLGGTGTVSGSVVVQANGTLAPGSSGMTGTINIGTQLSVVSGGFLAIKVNADNNTSDLINVTGTTNVAGAIIKISKLSGTYSVGDSFKLINCATITGRISGIIPDKPATGLYWDLSALNTSGTIKITDIPSAIHEVKQLEGVAVFPNPSKDKVQVTFPEIAEYSVRITTLSGQVVFSNFYKNTLQQTVDISYLSSGIYLFEVKSNSQSVVYRLIKM